MTRWVALAALACAGAAFAQTSTTSSTSSSSNTLGPAPGIKIGEGRLHPFLDVSGRFDSAIGIYGIDAATGRAVPSSEFILGFRGGTRFDLLTEATNIGFNGSLEYLYFTGALSPSSKNLSRLQANVGLETAFNKDGAVEVQLGDTFVRSDRTQNPVVDVGVLSLYNEVHLAAPIHPGGRALEITPRVGWGVEFFDPLLGGVVPGCLPGQISCVPSTLGQMNYSSLSFGLAGKYKFLPKTAVVINLNHDHRTYWNSTTNNRPADVFTGQVGLNGLITPRISLTLMAGVAHDFNVSNATGPTGQVQLSYIPNDATTLTAGYVRSLLPAPVYGVFADDRGYANVKFGFLGGRLSLLANFSVDYFSFFGTPANGVGGGRNDLLIGGGVGPSFAITTFLDVGASYNLGFRSSSATAITVNYTRHEALLHLTLHY